jgi:hypothetical protein
MSWELIGGIAGGLASAKRQADQDKDLKEYRREASELRKAQTESLRRRQEPQSMPLPGLRDDPAEDVDGDARRRFGMARGGMVGATNSEMSEWSCAGPASDLWQKQSFKK